MTERTKIIILILSQTALIGFDYAVEIAFGISAEHDLNYYVMNFINLLIYVGFGFITENAKQLFVHSAITALINIIFYGSDMYFNPNEYQETLQFYGDSMLILLCFAFVFIFFVCLIFISLGRILSYLFKVIFSKQANEF